METLKTYFYFDTVQLVTVHNVKVGSLHRFFQLAVILYIAIYSIYIKKGYQEYSPVKGALYAKTKGLAYQVQNDGTIVRYDSNDLVYPPIEPSAVFVSTAWVETRQNRGQCSSSVKCTSNDNCSRPAAELEGFLLPVCNVSDGFCLMESWCPRENDSLSNVVTLQGWENFTIFIRSSINYEKFNLQTADPMEPVFNRNLFTVKKMLGSTSISSCATVGCIVDVDIDWTCNLDKGVEDCKPTFNFVSVPGTFNFRTRVTNFARTDRDLKKLFGIRFLLKIKGTGGRFSFFQLIITIGSGLAFLSIATLIVDFILLTIFDKDFFELKYVPYIPNEESEKESTEGKAYSLDPDDP